MGSSRSHSAVPSKLPCSHVAVGEAAPAVACGRPPAHAKTGWQISGRSGETDPPNPSAQTGREQSPCVEPFKGGVGSRGCAPKLVSRKASWRQDPSRRPALVAAAQVSHRGQSSSSSPTPRSSSGRQCDGADGLAARPGPPPPAPGPEQAHGQSVRSRAIGKRW